MTECARIKSGTCLIRARACRRAGLSNSLVACYFHEQLMKACCLGSTTIEALLYRVFAMAAMLLDHYYVSVHVVYT
jgi:hypothetical protein